MTLLTSKGHTAAEGVARQTDQRRKRNWQFKCCVSGSVLENALLCCAALSLDTRRKNIPLLSSSSSNFRINHSTNFCLHKPRRLLINIQTLLWAFSPSAVELRKHPLVNGEDESSSFYFFFFFLLLPANSSSFQALLRLRPSSDKSVDNRGEVIAQGKKKRTRSWLQRNKARAKN